MFALKFTALLRNSKCPHEQCSPTSKCSQETFVTHQTEKHCSPWSGPSLRLRMTEILEKLRSKDGENCASCSQHFDKYFALILRILDGTCEDRRR
jgi:hypothetical protein